MIRKAKMRSETNQLEKKLQFKNVSILEINDSLGMFDCIISERCLQNLDMEQEQHRAFNLIMNRVKSGGRYYMIESSIDGLERINKLRISFDLNPITPPWHNTFLKEAFVASWANKNFILEEIVPFSSTYYLFSRVVYAKIAHDNGEELKYDSDINLLSMQLPIMGNFGPTRLWQWYKIK